ncbi:MAG: hypothetical protein U9Q67_02825 [Patescibacteria group bacterium]|nr:hypothetical protein [Patescibacteria group bacterium]
MIEHILVSKVRVKLLRLFFTDITKVLHIRAVARELDEEINAVRRELKNLTEAKIFKSQKSGNKIYYEINLKSPLFYEILGLVNKEFGLGSMILAELETIGKVKYAILTSNYVNNQKPSKFDVDLLLVGEIDLDKVTKIIKAAEKELKKEIRYTVMTDGEFIERKRKRDVFTRNIINRHKIMLVGNEDRLMS